MSGASKKSSDRSNGSKEQSMQLPPRRTLFHIIILLVVLAVPLFLPSSCGPALHSEAGLAARLSN
jgi:hypothetical protein